MPGLLAGWQHEAAFQLELSVTVHTAWLGTASPGLERKRGFIAFHTLAHTHLLIQPSALLYSTNPDLHPVSI